MGASDFFTAAARYDGLMGPIFFTPPARALALAAVDLVGVGSPDVLEIAAGTGRLTAEIHAAFPGCTITATDLAPPMVEYAASARDLPGVHWQVSDAQDLQVDDASFDLAFAQFGVMFYPDRRQALREALRALRPGGVYLQSSWDRLVPGDVDEAAARAIATLSARSAEVLRDVIHGYHEPAAIRADLEAAGFPDPTVDLVEVDVTTSPRAVGEALSQGSALQATLREDGVALDHAADLMADEIAGTLGIDPADDTLTSLRMLVGIGRAPSEDQPARG